MRFSDFRVTIEKRSAKTERLTRMAAHATLSTPRSVRPEPGAKDVYRPAHNRASLRQTRSGRRERVRGVALTVKPWEATHDVD